MKGQRAISWQVLIGLSVAWLVVAILGLIQLWPHIGDWRQAALFIALFPPFYVIGEGLNLWLLSPKHGAAVSAKRFSSLRILVALPVAAAWLGLSWLFVTVILK